MGNSRAYYLQLVYMLDLRKDVKELVELVSKEDFTQSERISSNPLEEVAFNLMLTQYFINAFGLADKFLAFADLVLKLNGLGHEVFMVKK